MRKWYPPILIAAMFIVSIAVYSRLPDIMPTHWNVKGEVNGTGPKWIGAFAMPIVMLVLWGVMRGLPAIDPQRDNYAKMQKAYALIINALVTTFAVLHIAMIAVALKYPVPLERLVPAMIGIMLIVTGNVLPQARRNWFFGVRTPWTLSNDRVWERTHRVAGYLTVITGVIALVTALFPASIGPAAIGIAGAATAVITITYSYIVWKREVAR